VSGIELAIIAQIPAVKYPGKDKALNPIANPSAGVMQSNQSFQLNRGLGNNPINRDAYVRYHN